MMMNMMNMMGMMGGMNPMMGGMNPMMALQAQAAQVSLSSRSDRTILFTQRLLLTRAFTW